MARQTVHRGLLFAGTLIAIALGAVLLAHPILKNAKPAPQGVPYRILVSRADVWRWQSVKDAVVSYMPTDRPFEEGEWREAFATATANRRGQAILYIPPDHVQPPPGRGAPRMFYFGAEHPDCERSCVGIFRSEIDKNGLRGGRVGIGLRKKAGRE